MRNHAPKAVYLGWLDAHPPVRAYAGREGQSLVEWQESVRADVRRCLGEQPAPVPPEPVLVGQSDQGDHRRQTWVLRTEADFWLPFHLLLPAGADGPRPAVLSLHGHGPGKSGNVGIDREAVTETREDFGLQAVRAGYVAFCPDLRGFGECTDEDHRDGRYDISCTSSAGRSIMLGRTLLGERTWDVLRGVDFLAARPEVDAGRIGCVGHSGGGTVALLAAALDPRIRVAVVNAAFCAWRHSIYGTGHCPCNYVPDLLRYADCGDLAAAIAPRPLLVNAGAQDPIFPLAGVREAMVPLAAAYAQAGVPDHAELFVGPGGHRFYPERTWSFLREWL